MSLKPLLLTLSILIFSQSVSAGCESYDRIETASAAELFKVLLTCDVETTHAKANLMMIIGQVRGLADLTSFPPSGKSDEEIVGSLYGTMYYRFGGLGPWLAPS